VRRFRWDFIIRLTIERTRDDPDDPDQAMRPWVRWAVLGLATIGVWAVIVYKLTRP
jgi:hypothetical protein